eukprot:1194758-Prorocentrum_minimum.AAC.6
MRIVCDVANEALPALQALQQRGDVTAWLGDLKADASCPCPTLHELDRHLTGLGLRLKEELSAAGIMKLTGRSDTMVGLGTLGSGQSSFLVSTPRAHFCQLVV